MRARVEVDTDKPLMRGVTVFSQRRNVTEWFDVQYEQLPHYCFACGILGHSSLECQNPGDRDADGKLPYSSDRMSPPDEKKKKSQGTRSASDSTSASQGRSFQQAPYERPGQSDVRGSSTRQNKQGGEDVEIASPGKLTKPCGRANQAKSGQNSGKEVVPVGMEGRALSGQKRKTQKVYRRVNPPAATVEDPNKAVVVFSADKGQEAHTEDTTANDVSNDSNKKMRRETFGSADQAGAVEQPRRTQ
jgi:hypothetical protein